jgi:hypothetical protein
LRFAVIVLISLSFADAFAPVVEAVSRDEAYPENVRGLGVP